MAPPVRRRLTPVRIADVALNDAFWAPRQAVNRDVTIPYEYARCKATGRIDTMKLGKGDGKGITPHVFYDSDVAKLVEAAAYSLMTHPDPALERWVDDYVDLMAKAQADDGYLNSYFLQRDQHKHWTNLAKRHELYCAGHLMEAAVAYFEATGKRAFLDIMCRYADHIDRTFGPKKGQKPGYPGHEEIELALVRLYRATGEERYLKLSKFFIDERGRTGRTKRHYYDIEADAFDEGTTVLSKEQTQSHQPVREQDVAVGHAVRAMYLYCGMADVAMETHDAELLAACKRLWRNVTERQMYLTGSVGQASHMERFTTDFDLPNELAYAETCAAIGLVFWAHRMLQMAPDARVADVMERALYNGVLSGISLDGTHFFYANRLAEHPAGHPEHVTEPAERFTPDRQEWFGCACCPPNLARLIASIGSTAYAVEGKTAYVHLYLGGDARLTLGNRTVRLAVRTKYPWDGRVRMTVRPDRPAAFGLALRVPGWCRKATFTVNGKAVRPTVAKGYAKLRREWTAGDTVEIDLPMPVERVEAHPLVRQDCGRTAVQRGPIVYCLEEVDNGAGLNDIALPLDATLRATYRKDMLGGCTVITGRATRRDPAAWGDALYKAGPTQRKSVPILAIPYALRSNRKTGEMIVWIRNG